jgi:hypothetical protein
MKKIFFTLPVFIVIIFLIFSFTNSKEKTNEKTEEYALLKVIERGNLFYIELTKGEQETIYEELEAEPKTRMNWANVTKKMNALNQEGYELKNESLTTIVSGQYGGGYTYESFIFVKKIK